jgi:hypothetical protein
MKASVIILIISHKEELTENELLSLRQCYKILGSYPIRILTPKGNSVDFYRTYLPDPVFDFIEPDRLSNYQKFNNYKISLELYQKFSDYELILFYEPDAFVFKDELKSWCKAGYDYIGAPWFETKRDGSIYINDVGNGGFSLRNVKSSIQILRELRYLEVLEQYSTLNWKGLLPRLPKLIKMLLKSRKRESNFERNFRGHEDGFWCRYAQVRLNTLSCNKDFNKFAKLFIKNDFKIAPVQQALKFSFEANPQLLYKMNGGKLPFGCHAWEKFDPIFWKSFITEKVEQAN